MDMIEPKERPILKTHNVNQYKGSIDLEAIKGKSEMLRYQNQSKETEANKKALKNRINILEKEQQRVAKKIKLTHERAQKLEE